MKNIEITIKEPLVSVLYGLILYVVIVGLLGSTGMIALEAIRLTTIYRLER